MSKIQSRCKTGLSLILSLAAFLVISGCSTTINPSPPPTLKTATECSPPNKAIVSYQSVIDSADPAIAQALKEFPKGGDIHNHLSGSIMPEDYIAMGIEGGYCYNTTSYAITTCSSGTPLLSDASATDIENIKQALSMYRYPYPDIQGGHDHFFSTFGKFGAISGTHQGEMFARLLEQAYDDNVTYVETMMSFGHDEFNALYNSLIEAYPNPADYTNPKNYPGMLDVLQHNGLPETINNARQQINQYEQTAQEVLRCGLPDQSGGCFVTYRIQGEVNRNPRPMGLTRVFIQAAINFNLAKADKRVVGVNLVSGEDLQTSMDEFGSQMDIFSFFNRSYPDVNIALHAGEITPCFVGEGNPALFDHLTRSLDAGAKRIGHGISFEYLNDDQRSYVANQMIVKRAIVEVPMTSNAQILGVTGDEHPFPLYFRNYNVPVCFATDDEGVSYNNFSNEWIYAYSFYRLSYDELLTLARNSLQYSFLQGEPLWTDTVSGEINSRCANDRPGAAPQSDDCKTFLNGNDKAALQWLHEMELHDFSNKYEALFRNRITQAASR
jgi:adenosine deaminase